MRIAITGASGLIGTRAERRTRRRRPHRGPRRPPRRRATARSAGRSPRTASTTRLRRHRRRRPPRRSGNRRSPLDRRLQARTAREPHGRHGARRRGDRRVEAAVGAAVRFGDRLLRSSPTATRFDETIASGDGFLADLCVAWEAAASRPQPRTRGSRSCGPASCCRPTAARSRSNCRCSSSGSAARWGGRPVAELDLDRRRGRRDRPSARPPTCPAREPHRPNRSPTPSSPTTLGDGARPPDLPADPEVRTEAGARRRNSPTICCSAARRCCPPCCRRRRLQFHTPTWTRAPRRAREVSRRTPRSSSSARASRGCRAPSPSTTQVFRVRCSKRATASEGASAPTASTGSRSTAGSRSRSPRTPNSTASSTWRRSTSGRSTRAPSSGAMAPGRRRRPVPPPVDDAPTAAAPIGSPSRQAAHRRAAPRLRSVHPALCCAATTSPRSTRFARPASPTRSSNGSSARSSAGSSSTRTCADSRRMFDIIFRMLADGDSAVPPPACRPSPTSWRRRLPDGPIEYRRRVESVAADHGRRRRRTVTAASVVVATEGPAAARLLGLDPVESKSVGCVYFAADEPPTDARLVVLDGDGRGPVLNVAVMSNVAPPTRPLGGTSSSHRSRATPARRWSSTPRPSCAAGGGRRSTRGSTSRPTASHTASRDSVRPSTRNDRSSSRRRVRLRRPPRHRVVQGAMYSGRRCADASPTASASDPTVRRRRRRCENVGHDDDERAIRR